MLDKNQTLPLRLTKESMINSVSAFSIHLSQSNKLSLHNQEIKKKLEKLNSISQSFDMSTLSKNPLNLIEYEMQGERSKHDSQMVLAKLRKLQNRAELHRASVELHQLDQQRGKSHNKTQKPFTHRDNFSQNKKQPKINYLKIYQNYLKQKQIEAEIKQRYEDDQAPERQEEYNFLDDTKDGITHFSLLKKHPRLLDLTMTRKKQKQGIIQKQMQTQRKEILATVLKKHQDVPDYEEQKKVEQERQNKRYFQNPEQVIERQITKFYMKKNPGKLTYEAIHNERSIELIKKQKDLFLLIQEQKIAKEDKKKLRNKFNDLANELAKSDRRKSLEGTLPKLRQSQTVKKIQLKENLKKKLFEGN